MYLLLAMVIKGTIRLTLVGMRGCRGWRECWQAWITSLSLGVGERHGQGLWRHET